MTWILRDWAWVLGGLAYLAVAVIVLVTLNVMLSASQGPDDPDSMADRALSLVVLGLLSVAWPALLLCLPFTAS